MWVGGLEGGGGGGVSRKSAPEQSCFLSGAKLQFHSQGLFQLTVGGFGRGPSAAAKATAAVVAEARSHPTRPEPPPPVARTRPRSPSRARLRPCTAAAEALPPLTAADVVAAAAKIAPAAPPATVLRSPPADAAPASAVAATTPAVAAATPATLAKERRCAARPPAVRDPVPVSCPVQGERIPRRQPAAGKPLERRPANARSRDALRAAERSPFSPGAAPPVGLSSGVASSDAPACGLALETGIVDCAAMRRKIRLFERL